MLIKPLTIFLFGIICSNAIAEQPQKIKWPDMIPRKTTSALSEPGPDGSSNQEDPWDQLDFKQPVAELNGRYVRIAGFVVPLESDEGGLLTEFMLVPYYGACIHVPPPPPNQIIYVTFEEAVNVEAIWDPYWLIGTLSTKPYEGNFAETVYQMSGERLEEY